MERTVQAELVCLRQRASGCDFQLPNRALVASAELGKKYSDSGISNATWPQGRLVSGWGLVTHGARALLQPNGPCG